VACGLGLPLPEDIALITGGFLAALGPPHGVGSVWAMMLVGLLGILVGDSIIFKAGKDYGDALLETRLGKHIPRDRVERVREMFKTHGPKLIVLARFLPGLRAVTYFVAGTSRVRFAVFALYDGLAALVSAPVWVWLGYSMERQHMPRRAYLLAKQFQTLIFVVVFVVLVCAFLWWLLNRRREARRITIITRGSSGDSDPFLMGDAANEGGSGAGSNVESLNEKRAQAGVSGLPPRPGIGRA